MGGCSNVAELACSYPVVKLRTFATLKYPKDLLQNGKLVRMLLWISLCSSFVIKFPKLWSLERTLSSRETALGRWKASHSSG